MKNQIEFKHMPKDFEDVWKIENQYLEPSTIAEVEQTIDLSNGLKNFQNI